MRILHVSPYFYPAVTYGGPVFSLYNLCRGLAQLGADVTVFTTNASGAGRLDTSKEVQWPEGVRVRYFDWDFGSRAFISLELARACWTEVAHYDLVHINGCWTFPAAFASFMARRFGVPYIISPRGSLEPWAISQKPFKKLFALALYERRSLSGAAALHFTSHEEARLSSWVFGVKRSYVVPNPVDLSEFQKLPPPGAFRARWRIPHDVRIIGFLGRLHRQKGLETMIEAFAVLQARAPNTILVLAGPDESGYKARISALAHAKGIEGRVLFPGLLQGDEKIGFLVDVDVFVLPSRQENFSNALVEAMACGAASVVTPGVNLHPSITENQVGIVARADAYALSDAIAKLLSDRRRALDMGRRARQWVFSQFGIDAVSAQMLRVYQEVLETGSESV